MSKGLITTANELVTFDNSQGQEVRGMILKLSHNVIVFEVYNPYSIVQLSEVLAGVKIVRANREIYQGSAVVTNIVNTGMVLIVSATLYDFSWKKDFDFRSKNDLDNEIDFLIKSYEREIDVDVDFKVCVLSIRSFLKKVKNWFDKLEASVESSGLVINEKFFLDNFKGLVEKISDLRKDFSDIVKRIDSDKMDVHRSFVQNQLHFFVLSSPFPHRTYAKPLGFAGDYMMMHMIQRDNAEGPSMFAKFINVFYTNIPMALSVKNRTDRLVELIEDGIKKCEIEGREFHALSIGCGPALEIKRFAEKNNPKVKCNFKLLDFNKETLDFAVNEALKVLNEKNIEVTTKLDSVHSLLKKSVNNVLESQRYDLVYCSGLFDYLSDKVCAKLTKMFFGMAKQDGKVFVTNMHSNNHDSKMMELIFEWYLIYRSESDVTKFFPGDKNKKIYTDSTGVNLCLELSK